jgi:hypothetical protein
MLLLRDHFDNTLAVNELARTLLVPTHINFIGPHVRFVSIARDLTLEPLLVQSWKRSAEQVGQMFKQFHFANCMPPKDLEDRGMKGVPDYPYGAVADRLWDVLHTYVRRVIVAFYV